LPFFAKEKMFIIVIASMIWIQIFMAVDIRRHDHKYKKRVYFNFFLIDAFLVAAYVCFVMIEWPHKMDM
jgi:hypothetical protein